MTGKKAVRALYISYDGMTDPLGRSQVLPYLVGLSREGHEITLISCEKPARGENERAAVREICTQAGIEWHALDYHARPPIISTIRDIAAMRRLAKRLQRARPFDLVHCRSYVAALVGLAIWRQFRVPFIFDTRSFLPDERAEIGMWDQSSLLYRLVYRYFKAREDDFLWEAGEVITQTQAGREDLLARAGGAAGRAPVSFIACCADFDFFTPVTPQRRNAARKHLGIGQTRRVAVYLGSVGTWYMLDQMLDLFAVQLERDPDALFLVISRDDPTKILHAAAERGIEKNSIMVRSALREEVPSSLAAADYAVSFIRPLPSKRGSAPVKLGEYLATELPVITNGSVGDVEAIIADSGAGVLVEGFDRQSYVRAIDQLERLEVDMPRLREAARKWFDLRTGIDAYDRIYRRLAGALR